MKLFKMVIALSIFFFVGCSSLNFRDPATGLAIQYATAKFIENGNIQQRATAIVDEVAKARNFIDMQSVPLSELKLRIIGRLASKGLSPADTLLATALIDAVERRIKADVARGILDEDEKIRVNQALDLIEDAASVYL